MVVPVYSVVPVCFKFCSVPVQKPHRLPVYYFFILYWQIQIFDGLASTKCLASMFEIFVPCQYKNTLCLKFGSVPVQKHTGCQYIIFSFCTSKCKFWFAGTIYSNLHRHSVRVFRDACRDAALLIADITVGGCTCTLRRRRREREREVMLGGRLPGCARTSQHLDWVTRLCSFITNKTKQHSHLALALILWLNFIITFQSPTWAVSRTCALLASPGSL
jgi:hypothetical protein